MTRLSNWKEESDLFEVVTGKMTDKEALKKVDEKKGIKNKIVINPKLTEAIKELGGELIEATEEDENGATVDPRKEAEKKSEDQKKKQIENKQKRAQMIKKQVLMKKLIAVRQGSEDIVAHHEPEGEVIEGYEATKRGEVLAAFKRDPKVRKRFEKSAKKEGGPGSVKNRAADSMLQTAKDTAKRKGDTSKSDDRYAYESAVLDANTKLQKKDDRKKKEKEYAKLMAILAHRKKMKEMGLGEEVVTERLGGKGYSKQAAASSVYPGKKGTGDWEDSDRGAGNKAARRAGKKVEKKSPTYLAHVHNKKVNEDKALELVRANIIKKHGKGAIYDPKKKQSPKDKAKVAAERKKRQDADNKAYAARAKKAGFKSTQDYTNVIARYGSEDNYKKGRGLGT